VIFLRRQVAGEVTGTDGDRRREKGGKVERFDGFAVLGCTFEEIAEEPRIANPWQLTVE